jgi:hypothetical protein
MSNTAWTEVVARGASRKVSNVVRRPPTASTKDRPIITTLYEDEDLQDQLVLQRAAAIAQDALHNDSVLFTFHEADFEHRSEAYSLIQDQIGVINNVRPISQMGFQQRSDLILEVQFAKIEGRIKAINEGVTFKDKCYKGTSSNSKSSLENIVRVQLSNVPWNTGLTTSDFVSNMKLSLSHFGRVCQLRKHTCTGGFFEGDVSVLLDITENEGAEKPPLLKLQRNLYLEWCERYVTASFKGADPVCFYCRQAGHRKAECPKRLPVVCYGCHRGGHIRRNCPNKNPIESTSEEESENEGNLLDKYMVDSLKIAEENAHKEKKMRSRKEKGGMDSADKEKSPKEDPLEDEPMPEVGILDEGKQEDIESANKQPQFEHSSDGSNASKYAPIETGSRMQVDSEPGETKKSTTQLNDPDIKEMNSTNSNSLQQTPNQTNNSRKAHD